MNVRVNDRPREHLAPCTHFNKVRRVFWVYSDIPPHSYAVNIFTSTPPDHQTVQTNFESQEGLDCLASGVPGLTDRQSLATFTPESKLKAT